MPTTITQNNNTVKITLDNPVITVTDNNKGTSVDVTQVDITTVSVVSPGPKGAVGTVENNSGMTVNGNLSVTGAISGFGNILATSNTAAIPHYLGHINASSISTVGSLTGHITASGNISGSGNLDITGNANIDGTITIANNTKIQGENASGAERDIAYISAGNRLFLGDTNQGTTVQASAANLILDSAGDITIDADSGNVYFKDGESTSITVNTKEGHITASGEISSSNKIYANQFQAETSFRLNDSGGTDRHVLRSAVTGNEIELGNSNFSGIEITGHVSASGDITASGNIYSANFDSIPLSFQASGDGTNWYGPNKQGPYYYVYNYNYGDNTAVATLAQEYVVAGLIVPYKCELIGFQAVASHIGSEHQVRIALYQGAGGAATFDVTSGTADDLTLELLGNASSGTPGAAENPMKITKLDMFKPLAQGDMIYPRVFCGGAGGAYVSMHILIRRRP